MVRVAGLAYEVWVQSCDAGTGFGVIMGWGFPRPLSIVGWKCVWEGLTRSGWISVWMQCSAYRHWLWTCVGTHSRGSVCFAVDPHCPNAWSCELKVSHVRK